MAGEEVWPPRRVFVVRLLVYSYTESPTFLLFNIYGYEHASRWPVPAIFLGKQIAFQICSPCTYADSEASRDDLSIWTVLWQLRLCSQLCHLPGLTIVWDFDWRLIAEVEVNLASSSQYANFKLDGSDREEPERSSSSFYFHPVRKRGTQG